MEAHTTPHACEASTLLTIYPAPPGSSYPWNRNSGVLRGPSLGPAVLCWVTVGAHGGSPGITGDTIGKSPVWGWHVSLCCLQVKSFYHNGCSRVTLWLSWLMLLCSALDTLRPSFLTGLCGWMLCLLQTTEGPENLGPSV